jgi:hypothetical protein
MGLKTEPGIEEIICSAKQPWNLGSFPYGFRANQTQISASVNTNSLKRGHFQRECLQRECLQQECLQQECFKRGHVERERLQ